MVDKREMIEPVAGHTRIEPELRGHRLEVLPLSLPLPLGVEGSSSISVTFRFTISCCQPPGRLVFYLIEKLDFATTLFVYLHFVYVICLYIYVLNLCLYIYVLNLCFIYFYCYRHDADSPLQNDRDGHDDDSQRSTPVRPKVSFFDEVHSTA